MSLEKWAEMHVLEKFFMPAQEIREFQDEIDKEITEFQISLLSNKTRYILAYNVTLRLAVIALYALGYRIIERTKHHYYAISSLSHTIGLEEKKVRALDKARQKRHENVYEAGDTVTEKELEELLVLVTELHERVKQLVRSKYGI